MRTPGKATGNAGVSDVTKWSTEGLTQSREAAKGNAKKEEETDFVQVDFLKNFAESVGFFANLSVFAPSRQKTARS
jgi:hypothetical protein